jgi:RNA polymerase sigma-70 factor (ECF subfamily)
MDCSNSKQRDQDWAERVRRGDREAFEALFRAYADDLCGFAAGHVGEQAAEDIVQDVFCDLWNRRADWRPQSVRAYLFGAVRNTALDRLKHRRVEQAWEAEEKYRGRPSGLESPTDVLQHHELKRAMQQAVEALPERRRLVYRMVRQQGMSYAETAEVLGIAPKTVENQMGRALKMLRERLSKFASALQ